MLYIVQDPDILSVKPYFINFNTLFYSLISHIEVHLSLWHVTNNWEHFCQWYIKIMYFIIDGILGLIKYNNLELRW